MQPRGFGGLELPFGIQTDLSIELARACPSSGWVAAILACHAWMLGMLPGEAQADVWGDAPDATVATSFLCRAPRVERAPGGIRLTGRWEFSSGVDYCGWTMLLVRAPAGDDGPPTACFALVPLSDCRIEDCWHATGLAGTGSNDVLLENVFVPDYRLGDMRDMCDGNGPGRAVNDGYLYRLPQLAVFSFNLVGTAIGAARGARNGGRRAPRQAVGRANPHRPAAERSASRRRIAGRYRRRFRAGRPQPARDRRLG